jgi:hypothetical protein
MRQFVGETEMSRLTWITTAALIATALAGCKKQGSGSAPASSAENTPTLSAASGGNHPSAQRRYDSFKKSQVDKVMSDETRTESEVVAILGEPSERSELRHYTNRFGEFTEYDLTWLKTGGEIAVKVTFMNGKRSGVISTVVN